jgi:hypothetical protein
VYLESKEFVAYVDNPTSLHTSVISRLSDSTTGRSATSNRFQLTVVGSAESAEAKTRSHTVYVYVLPELMSDEWLTSFLDFLDPTLLHQLEDSARVVSDVVDRLSASAVVMVVEDYLLESLFLLRAALCLSMQDVVSIELEALRKPGPTQWAASGQWTSIKKAVREYYVHQAMTARTDPRFQDNMSNYTQTLDQLQTVCQRTGQDSAGACAGTVGVFKDALRKQAGSRAGEFTARAWSQTLAG